MGVRAGAVVHYKTSCSKDFTKLPIDAAQRKPIDADVRAYKTGKRVFTNVIEW